MHIYILYVEKSNIRDVDFFSPYTAFKNNTASQFRICIANCGTTVLTNIECALGGGNQNQDPL